MTTIAIATAYTLALAAAAGVHALWQRWQERRTIKRRLRGISTRS